MFRVNVSPDMGMYNLLRSQGYDPAFALAEFIDNALHAYQEKCKSRIKAGDPLRVELKFYSTSYHDRNLKNGVTIVDDGPGILKTQLPEAMKPARPKHASGLSEFGIGMKAAAVWFADTWELATRPQGQKKQYKLSFDLDVLLASGSDVLEVEEIILPSLKSGTEITLKSLRRPLDANKYTDICDTLRELYQRFTTGAVPLMILTASLDGTPRDLKFIPLVDRQVLSAPIHMMVNKKLYAVGPEKTWSVPISMIFNGVPIEGHVCLMEKGSYKHNPGLVLFRNGRVISGTTKRPNIPAGLFGTSNKYAAQRVYGELHLDGLPVAYTKDKFEIDEDAFIDQLRQNRQIQDLIAQAENYRTNGAAERVSEESDIPGREHGTKSSSGPASPEPPKRPHSPAGSSKQPPKSPQAEPGAKPAPKRPVVQQPLVVLLEQLKPKARRIALTSIIEEAIYQYKSRRNVGAALCLRLVLELGVMTRIEDDFPSEYSKVSEKGISALLNYMHSNSVTFFDKKADHRVVKCFQSRMAGEQDDVVLLNNVAHGHWQPSRDEIDRCAKNLEPLLRWAYS